MSISRRHIKRYIEYFLRYSARVNYKNIIFTIMAVGALELSYRIVTYFPAWRIQHIVANRVSRNIRIIDICLGKLYEHPVVQEFFYAFRAGYESARCAFDWCPFEYADLARKDLSQELTFVNCADFMSLEDLAAIENALKILSYGLILKLFIDAIPPMPQANDLDTAILRSLMVGQEKDTCFPEIVAEMIKRLDLTESDLEQGLKEARAWVPCALTRAPILFPVMTNTGRSYDMTSLLMLQASNRDPITAQALTDIYYNKTLFNIIYEGIRDVLNKHALSEEKKEAFEVQWMGINQVFQQNLAQKQWVVIQPEKEEPSLFAMWPAWGVVLASGVFFLLTSYHIPEACHTLEGWQNPLPQLCADIESVLELRTQGFEGVFIYGGTVAVSGEHINHKDDPILLADILDNPLKREYGLREAQSKALYDLNIDGTMIALMGWIIIISLLFFLLIRILFLGVKSMRENLCSAQGINDALSLHEDNQRSSVHKEEQGLTLQQLKDQYQKIQSQPNAERDKLTTLLLCTGCSSSYFRAQHEPCRPGAKLIIDYDTTQLVADFPLTGQDKTEALNQKIPKPP